MLGYFPIVGEDESLYSVYSHIYDELGSPDENVFSYKLFGSESIHMPSIFSYGVDSLLSNIPLGHSWTSTKIIDQLTLAPLFSYFSTQEQSLMIKHILSHSKHERSLYDSLRKARFTNSTTLRYCSTCAVEDIQTLGRAYWHRSHQPTNVIYCYKHRIPLQNTDIAFFKRPKKYQFISLDSWLENNNSKEYVSIPRHWESQLCQLSIDCHHLLNTTNDSYHGLRTFYRKIDKRMAELGYFGRGGRLKKQLFFEGFREHFTTKLLSRLEFGANTHQAHRWVHRIMYKREERWAAPFEYLLLIYFLFGDLNSFISYDPDVDHEFGSGPWPCLFQHCLHFKLDVIEKMHLNVREPKLYAEFTCPHCGFAYRRFSQPGRAKQI